jgi:integrase/recombinase XerD
MRKLFERFITERKYLKNITASTEYSYHNAKNALFRLYGSDFDLQDLSKDKLSSWVISMRTAGLSPGACNVYIRTVNAFLRWLHLEGYTDCLHRVAKLKEQQKVVQTFTAQHVHRFIHWKSANSNERRLHSLILLLLDTGLRIEEALTLRKDQVDLENTLLTVNGKGNKQRVIPISLELRKRLFRHLQDNEYSFVFCTRDGARLSQDNVRRDMRNLAARLGITGVRVSAHTFRHCFAVNYIRNGGDVFRLQRMLGHSTLEMTRRYVNLQTEDLQAVHNRLSLLARG